VPLELLRPQQRKRQVSEQQQRYCQDQNCSDSHSSPYLVAVIHGAVLLSLQLLAGPHIRERDQKENNRGGNKNQIQHLKVSINGRM
jgi:hypothetical protein